MAVASDSIRKKSDSTGSELPVEGKMVLDHFPPRSSRQGPDAKRWKVSEARGAAGVACRAVERGHVGDIWGPRWP